MNPIEDVHFYEELDNFELPLPGRGNELFPFSDNQVLLEMLHRTYPDWKERGKITSVPIARIPLLFLHNQAMCKQLEKQLKSSQKGEFGERMVYKLFAHGNFDDHPGIIIFPNFDASHAFVNCRTEVSKVEIDMVLVHQRKGVFIFNVKNVGGSTLSLDKLRQSNDKQRHFIKLLMNYNSEQDMVPIHTIICNFVDGSERFRSLEDITDNATLVFNKSDLNPANFFEVWNNRINDVDANVNSSSALEILVARLVSLSSLEKTAAIIHQNMQSGFLQALVVRKNLEVQISHFEEDTAFKDLVIELSEVANQRGRRKFILWTTAQLSTIANIYERLMNPDSNNGMRVLVEGCKSSGKTLLLLHIAKLAQRIFESRNENGHGRIMVFVGCRREGVLIEELRAAFNREVSREIVIHDNPCKFSFLFSWKTFD